MTGHCPSNAIKQLLLVFCIIRVTLILGENQLCGKFHLENSTLKVGTDTWTINITFQYISLNCKHIYKDIIIEISSLGKDTFMYVPQCTIKHTLTDCRGSKIGSTQCACLVPYRNFRYNFQSVTSTSVIRYWKLSTPFINAKEEVINFTSIDTTTISPTTTPTTRKTTHNLDVSFHLNTQEKSATVNHNESLIQTSDARATNQSSMSDSGNASVITVIVYVLGGVVFVVIIIVAVNCVILKTICTKDKTLTNVIDLIPIMPKKEISFQGWTKSKSQSYPCIDSDTDSFTCSTDLTNTMTTAIDPTPCQTTNDGYLRPNSTMDSFFQLRKPERKSKNARGANADQNNSESFLRTASTLHTFFHRTKRQKIYTIAMGSTADEGVRDCYISNSSNLDTMLYLREQKIISKGPALDEGLSDCYIRSGSNTGTLQYINERKEIYTSVPRKKHKHIWSSKMETLPHQSEPENLYSEISD